MFFRHAFRLFKFSKSVPLLAAASFPIRKTTHSIDTEFDTLTLHGYYPALVEAAKNGDIWEIEYHLQYHAPLDKEGEPLSALAAAAQAGKVNAVAYLISQGADLDYVCKGGVTPLMLAIANGHLVCAEALLEEGCMLNIRDDHHQLPLHHALNAPKNKKEIIELLIKVGCRPDDNDFYIPSPLHFAAQQEDTEALKTLLNASNVNVDVNWRELGTPLFTACAKGRIENAKLLIKRGANVNAKAEDGSTPLHAAARSGNLEIVKLLVENGAKYTFDVTKRSPIQFTTQPSVIDYFLSNVSKKDDKNVELITSVVQGSNVVLEYLLKSGVDVNALVNGETALHVAIKRKDINTALLLLNNGARMDVKDASGKTPEDIADPETLKILRHRAVPGGHEQSSSSEVLKNEIIKSISKEQQKEPLVQVEQDSLVQPEQQQVENSVKEINVKEEINVNAEEKEAEDSVKEIKEEENE